VQPSDSKLFRESVFETVSTVVVWAHDIYINSLSLERVLFIRALLVFIVSLFFLFDEKVELSLDSFQTLVLARLDHTTYMCYILKVPLVRSTVSTNSKEIMTLSFDFQGRRNRRQRLYKSYSHFCRTHYT